MREDWMTKPMAPRPKTDAQLAAEDEEREQREAEEKRRDPDQPFVSVGGWLGLTEWFTGVDGCGLSRQAN